MADALGDSIFCNCGSTFWPGMTRNNPATTVIRFQPGLDHAQAGIERSALHLALLDHVFARNHQYITAALVAAERGVGHEQRAGIIVDRHPDADEKAGQQHAVGIGHDAAHRHVPVDWLIVGAM